MSEDSEEKQFIENHVLALYLHNADAKYCGDNNWLCRTFFQLTLAILALKMPLNLSVKVRAE